MRLKGDDMDDIDMDDEDMDIENKGIAAEVFSTICTTLVAVENTSEINDADKLLELWVKVATVVTETNEDDPQAVLDMLKSFKTEKH